MPGGTWQRCGGGEAVVRRDAASGRTQSGQLRGVPTPTPTPPPAAAYTILATLIRTRTLTLTQTLTLTSAIKVSQIARLKELCQSLPALQR